MPTNRRPRYVGWKNLFPFALIAAFFFLYSFATRPQRETKPTTPAPALGRDWRSVALSQTTNQVSPAKRSHPIEGRWTLKDGDSLMWKSISFDGSSARTKNPTESFEYSISGVYLRMFPFLSSGPATIAEWSVDGNTLTLKVDGWPETLRYVRD